MPDMNDKNDAFDKWIIWRFRPTINHGLLRFTIDSMRESWNAALESTKEKRFGCHNGTDHPISSYCALDDNDDKDHCQHASRLYDQGRAKVNCPYWREIK